MNTIVQMHNYNYYYNNYNNNYNYYYNNTSIHAPVMGSWQLKV